MVRVSTKKKAVEEKKNPEILEDGSLYIDRSGLRYNYYYIKLGDFFYDLKYGYKSTCVYPNVEYIGNLKDFRPDKKREGFFGSNHVEISKNISGYTYEDWYKMDSKSVQEETKQAIQDFLKTVPGFVFPVSEKPKRKFFSSWFNG